MVTVLGEGEGGGKSKWDTKPLEFCSGCRCVSMRR